MQYGWALEFPDSNVTSTIRAWEFLDYKKKVRLMIFFIDILMSNSNAPSMYTFTMETLL